MRPGKCTSVLLSKSCNEAVGRTLMSVPVGGQECPPHNSFQDFVNTTPVAWRRALDDAFHSGESGAFKVVFDLE